VGDSFHRCPQYRPVVPAHADVRYRQTHAEAAEAIENLARELYGDDGHFLVRIGKPPKRAVPFRCEVPFRKIFRSFVAADGSKHKIELLADGQQLAAFGFHPDTRKPYRWHGGCPGPVQYADLPRIDATAAHDLVEMAVQLLVEDFGFRLTGLQARAETGAALGDSDPGDHVSGEPRAGPERLAVALAAIPNDGGWEEWNRLGMALWAATAGSEEGFALFDEWSQQSMLYDSANTKKKWDAYSRSPPCFLGAGTVFWLARLAHQQQANTGATP
jgi:hypothetical protein